MSVLTKDKFIELFDSGGPIREDVVETLEHYEAKLARATPPSQSTEGRGTEAYAISIKHAIIRWFYEESYAVCFTDRQLDSLSSFLSNQFALALRQPAPASAAPEQGCDLSPAPKDGHDYETGFHTGPGWFHSPDCRKCKTAAALLVQQAEQAERKEIIEWLDAMLENGETLPLEGVRNWLAQGGGPDALEAVRIEAQLEEIELAEEKMGHNQVSAQHDGCWLCERKYSLQQKRAKLSENTGTKP